MKPANHNTAALLLTLNITKTCEMFDFLVMNSRRHCKNESPQMLSRVLRTKNPEQKNLSVSACACMCMQSACSHVFLGLYACTLTGDSRAIFPRAEQSKRKIRQKYLTWAGVSYKGCSVKKRGNLN